MVDTLRADHTSLHGYDRPTTPAIDRWAEQGTVYERAWSVCSWTTPAMAMLLTGQVRIENDGRLLASQETLPELLRRAGYRTGAVVSNRLLNASLGYERGFDDYALVPRERAVRGWLADEVVDQGIAWLARHDERPSFLYLHLFDPHGPYSPQEETFERRDDPARMEAFRAALPPEDRERLTERHYRGLETFVARYDAEVLQADRALARLFEHLEREGLADETLVLLTSDHGEGLWQRAMPPGETPRPHAFFPRLYDAHGIQLYSEQVHVPLVLRGPGVARGVREARDVTLLDVVPTLVGLLGLPEPRSAGGLHGVDLMRLDESDRTVLFSICSRGTTITVDGRWRLHEPREYRAEQFGARPELYDLLRDPLELEPIDDPDRTAALSAQIAAFRARYARSDPELALTQEDQMELMRAMGYTGGEGDL